MAWAIFRINASGKADLLVDINQGSADIGVINDESMVLVPMMLDDKVIAISHAEFFCCNREPRLIRTLLSKRSFIFLERPFYGLFREPVICPG